MKKEKDTTPPRRVYCGHCCNGVRDTEGRSFSIVTGEYFMGRCPPSAFHILYFPKLVQIAVPTFFIILSASR